MEGCAQMVTWNASDVIERIAEDLRDVAARAQQTGARLKAHPENDVDVCGGRCPSTERMRQSLKEAIAVLEKTRSSFKSKELGALRRQLEAALEQP